MGIFWVFLIIVFWFEGLKAIEDVLMTCDHLIVINILLAFKSGSLMITKCNEIWINSLYTVRVNDGVKMRCVNDSK